MKSGAINEYWQAMRAPSPRLRRWLLAMALVFMTGFGLLPVLQNLDLLRLGFDVQFIGLLVGLGQLVWAAAALPAGVQTIARAEAGGVTALPYHKPQGAKPRLTAAQKADLLGKLRQGATAHGFQNSEGERQVERGLLRPRKV